MEFNVCGKYLEFDASSSIPVCDWFTFMVKAKHQLLDCILKPLLLSYVIEYKDEKINSNFA